MLITSSKSYIQGGFLVSEMLLPGKRRYLFAGMLDKTQERPVHLAFAECQAASMIEDGRAWVQTTKEIFGKTYARLGGLLYAAISIKEQDSMVLCSAGPLRVHHIDPKRQIILQSNQPHGNQPHANLGDASAVDSVDGLRSLGITDYPAVQYEWGSGPRHSLLFVCSPEFHEDRPADSYIRQAYEFNVEPFVGYHWILMYQIEINSLDEEDEYLASQVHYAYQHHVLNWSKVS